MTALDLMVSSPRHKLVVWTAAIALIVAGVYLSHIRLLGHEWLSRSGCAIVILGIWSGLGSLMQERFLTGRLRWRRRNAITRAKAELAAKQTPPEEIKQRIDEIEHNFAQQTAKLSQELKLSLGVLEFSLLTTGTFLWGFGDLLVEFAINR